MTFLDKRISRLAERKSGMTRWAQYMEHAGRVFVHENRRNEGRVWWHAAHMLNKSDIGVRSSLLNGGAQYAPEQCAQIQFDHALCSQKMQLSTHILNTTVSSSTNLCTPAGIHVLGDRDDTSIGCQICRSDRRVRRRKDAEKPAASTVAAGHSTV